MRRVNGVEDRSTGTGPWTEGGESDDWKKGTLQTNRDMSETRSGYPKVCSGLTRTGDPSWGHIEGRLWNSVSGSLGSSPDACRSTPSPRSPPVVGPRPGSHRSPSFPRYHKSLTPSTTHSVGRRFPVPNPPVPSGTVLSPVRRARPSQTRHFVRRGSSPGSRLSTLHVH